MAEEKRTGTKLDFCLHLRTKRYYASDDPPAEYLTEDLSETGYWCLRTMGTFGPDDDFACPSACGSHRLCYKSSIERSA